MLTLIQNAALVNEGITQQKNVYIKDEKILRITRKRLSELRPDLVIEGEGKHLFPGVIDDQVHFREPGLTHKADIYTEAKAAVAGGITSYMEMPNTIPQNHHHRASRAEI